MQKHDLKRLLKEHTSLWKNSVVKFIGILDYFNGKVY